jgi:AcrR family transcriptional regulator
MTVVKEKLRADAQINRDRILEVARDALVVDPAVSLNCIAKTAGVGAGTLYRHFPNREALVLAVYRKEIAALAVLAPRLLVEHPPMIAFRIWCDRIAKFGRTKQGVADVLKSTISDHDFHEVYGPILGAVSQLIAACETSGDISPGLEALDFLVLVSFLWRAPPDPAGEARSKRLLAFVFRGLSAGA